MRKRSFFYYLAIDASIWLALILLHDASGWIWLGLAGANLFWRVWWWRRLKEGDSEPPPSNSLHYSPRVDAGATPLVQHEQVMAQLKEASAAPAAAARALPLASYVDPELFAKEVESMFHSDWVYACMEGEVPEAGDQLSVWVGSEPVIVLRGQDHQLRALSNLCQHKGTLLLQGKANGKKITCPYHAWTYDDTGQLLGAPLTSREELDFKAHCLPEYRVETFAGLVFVCLDRQVESLASRLDSVADYVDRYLPDRYEPYYPEHQGSEVWQANWKLVLANAMESYHLFRVHPKTLEPFTPTKESFYVAGSARATVTGGAKRTDTDDDPRDPEGLGDFERHNYLLLSLPPSFVAIFDRRYVLWEAVQPLAPDRSRIRTGMMIAKGRQPSLRGFFRDLKELAREPSADFLPEDKFICERGQVGATGRVGSGGQLTAMEQVVGDFHQYLAWRLFGRNPDPVVHARQKRDSAR